MRYRIDILDCKGCQKCVFSEFEKRKTEINKGQMIIETYKIREKKCHAIKSKEKINRGNIFKIKSALKNLFSINSLEKQKTQTNKKNL